MHWLVLGQLEEGSWAYVSRSPYHRDMSHHLSLPSQASRLYKAMPMMYTEGQDFGSVVIGVGNNQLSVCSDLEVDVAAQSEPIVTRLYDSECGSGRCFCCEYLYRLHYSVHHNLKFRVQHRRTQLSEQFYQNTNGSLRQ